MAKDTEIKRENEGATNADDQAKKCGIIMPIADTLSLGYKKGHWDDVRSIIEEAFEGTEFKPRLVSKNDSIGLIHGSIVTNIYSDEIVICDVSTKNPNVMFELGMRLAFDKPVIIIKDDMTEYSFDTSPIEHLNYDSSLRFQNIVSFKKELRTRAIATYEDSKKPNFSPYLKSFHKTIVPGKIETVEVTGLQYIIDSIANLNSDMDKLAGLVEKDIKSDSNREVAENGKIYKRTRKVSLDELWKEIKNISSGMDFSKLSNEEVTDTILRRLSIVYLSTYGTAQIREMIESIVGQNLMYQITRSNLNKSE